MQVDCFIVVVVVARKGIVMYCKAGPLHVSEGCLHGLDVCCTVAAEIKKRGVKASAGIVKSLDLGRCQVLEVRLCGFCRGNQCGVAREVNFDDRGPSRYPRVGTGWTVAIDFFTNVVALTAQGEHYQCRQCGHPDLHLFRDLSKLERTAEED